jgi:hypothetical protein
MSVENFPGKAFTEGVHSEWRSFGMSEAMPLPEVQVESHEGDDFIFIEVHNSEGYTFIQIDPFTATELGLALIQHGARIQNRMEHGL